MEHPTVSTSPTTTHKVTKHSGTARSSIASDVVFAHLNDPNFTLPRPKSVEDPIRPSEVAAIPVVLPGPTDEASQKESEEYVDKKQPSSSPQDVDDESPYPEVRAAVPNVDYTWMSVNTFRAWSLGTLYNVIFTALNQFFYMRYPTLQFTSLVVQLTALPLGKVLEWTLPTTRIYTFGYGWSFNPGPFSIKEHVVITVMANAGLNAYATDVLAAQRFFYGQPTSFTYQMVLLLSTQLAGFAMGGLVRPLVVWPASMLWPKALVSSVLFTALHKNFGMKNSRHISREKFLAVVVACSFIWYWVPGYLWTGLSAFNWPCWIAPENIPVNQIFGTLSGLGMGIATFDWSMVSILGSPLVTPWWSIANTMTSFVIFYWVATPILYYTNTWFAKFLPISTNGIFDNTGSPYNLTAILTDDVFDAQKYRAYSPPFLPVTRVISYGLALASFTAAVVHTFLWYRSDIARRFKNTLKDERDIHSRLMQAYPEVPQWWFAVIGVTSLILLGVAVEIFPTELPVWGMLVAVLISGLFSIPSAIILAMTNITVYLNVISEVLAGYMFKGKPVANMIFKSIGVMVSSQASTYAGDMKLGHYMKIPPRVMFFAQVAAVITTCFVTNAVQDLMFEHIPDLCSPDQKDGFTCSSTNTFATASLLWGVIGPQRLFNHGAMYTCIAWFFLLGALSPIPFYFLAYRFPYSIFRFINMPIFFAGVSAIPSVSGINYSSWGLVGFIFNYVIRRRHFRWWVQYNYILSAGLDSGVALGVIFIYFTLQLPKGGIDLNWWGNTVAQNTADANRTSLWSLGANQTFGPAMWS